MRVETSQGDRGSIDLELGNRHSELVLALVAALGTDLGMVTGWIEDRLKLFSYRSKTIRISDFAATVSRGTPSDAGELERLDGLMTACNEMRRTARREDVLALYAANAIAEPQAEEETRAFRPRQAYVIRSVKRPEEVATLRRIYGAGFFLIAVSSSRPERLAYLTRDKGMSQEEAERLLARDEAEEADPFGQRTRETYHLADVFISEKKHLWRFLDLVFGEPYATPFRDEYAMFLAFAASVRSGDLSRQVGAVIVSEGGEVIATGVNDVPSPRGGTYWPEDEDDQRDAKLGFDPNEARRNTLVIDVTKRLRPDLAGRSDGELLAVGRELLTGSPLLDLTEFHRAVHAEMEALLSCARSGTPVRNATLFSTTYPCHNCAKHIVDAGIRRVVYVEPYAKSLAEMLHGDAIKRGDADATREPHEKVTFDPFVGVGPRRFIDLFSMTLGPGEKRVRKQGGKTRPFDKAGATLRVPMMPSSYIERETLAAALLESMTVAEGADE